MVYFDSFIKGLKVSWIHYLNTETTAPWVQLAKHIVVDIDKVVLFGLVGHSKRQNKLTNFSGKMLFLPGSVYYRTFAKSVIFMKKYTCLEIMQATLGIPELYQ